MHYDPVVFPIPRAFNPERWLEREEDDYKKGQARRQRQEKQYVPFSKGTRMCLGYNLGLAELYLA